MNTHDSPTPLDPLPPTTEEQLGTLCRRQITVIQNLRDEVSRLERSNQKLGGELLEASEARAEALVSIQHGLTRGKELCHHLVTQRDTILQALRSLCAHLANQPITSLTYFGGEAFAKSVREANELLTVIDQLQAKQKAADERAAAQIAAAAKSGATPPRPA